MDTAKESIRKAEDCYAEFEQAKIDHRQDQVYIVLLLKAQYHQLAAMNSQLNAIRQIVKK